MIKLSLVVPCYNECDNVLDFYNICDGVFKDKFECEYIFINDGSKDATWNRLKEICNTHHSVPIKIINFSRNFGKESAIYAGLSKAEGEYTVIIDADLQQRPEVALKMVEILDKNPDVDMVAAYQDKRIESKTKIALKSGFYKFTNKMCEIELKENASDFRVFRRNVRKAVLDMPEYYRFSKGIFSWVGFNVYFMPYVAEKRNSGESSWSTRNLFKYALDGIVSFSTTPLKIATFAGIALAVSSFIYMIVIIIQKLAFGISIPGYATIVVLLLLIGGVQLITTGILGLYIGKIYIQGKNRPIFIEKDYIKNQ